MYIYTLFIILLVALHTNPCANSSLRGLATPHLLPSAALLTWQAGCSAGSASVLTLRHPVHPEGRGRRVGLQLCRQRLSEESRG